MYLRVLNSITISLIVVLEAWSPISFQGFNEVKAIKIILRYHWPFYCADMCTDGAKAMMSTTDGPQNKSVAPNYTNSQCNLYHHIVAVKKKVPISLDTFNKVVKKYLSPLAHSFLILCDKMEVCIKRSSYTPKYEGYFEEKYLSIEYSVKLSLFFHGIPISLEKTSYRKL